MSENYRTPVIIFFYVVILIGAALRFFALGAESLWYDEVFAIRMASQPIAEVLAAEKFNPPLYFLTLHFWLKFIGSDSEASARLLSAIFGLISLGLGYYVLNEIANKKIALATTAYMAISSFHIYFAQEAKTYTLHLVLTLVSSLLFWRIYKSKGSIGIYLGLILVNVLALYSHYYSVFFVASQNLFLLFNWSGLRKILKPWIISQVLIVLFYLPWLANMFAAAGSGGQVRRHFFLKIPQAFFSMLLGDTLIPMDELAVLNIKDTLLGHWHYLALACMAFGLLFILCIRKFSFKDESLRFFAIMSLGPVLMAIVVSFKVMLFEERYFFFTTPYLYALIVWGLLSIPKNRWPILLILGILWSTSTFNYFFHDRFGKDQWREAVQYVEDNYREGDKLILLPNYIDLCWDYYRKKDIPTLKVTGKREKIGSPGWQEVSEFGLSTNRLWYVRSFLRDDSQPKWFAKRFASDIKYYLKTDKGIEIYLFEGNAALSSE